MRQQQNARYLIWMLSKTDFRLRYHGSVLGFLWAVLKPLFIFLILNFVFSHLFGGTKEYSLGLLTGLMLWNFFSEGTMTGLGALLSKAHILRKINAPAWTMVLASTLTSLYTFLLSLGILALFFLGYGVLPSLSALILTLPYLVALIIFVTALSFVLAPLYVHFRDLNQIWEVVLTAGFYATPIIYPMTSLPANIQGLLALNPLAHLMEGMKSLLVSSGASDLLSYGIQGGILLSTSVLLLGIAILIFHFQSRGIAEYV